jgi:hypothetical protein
VYCGTVLRQPAALIQAAKGSSPRSALATRSQGDLLNAPKRLNKREYFDSLRLHDSRRPWRCG